MDSPEQWALYDSEAASFSLKTWRIAVNYDHEYLARLTTAPVLPGDATALSVLAHEYHHWVSSFCSTYGFLINTFRYQAANHAWTIAQILRATSPLRKPAISTLRANISRYVPKTEIEGLIRAYTNSRQFVDLLVGSRSAAYSTFRDLLPDVLQEFQRAKNNLSRYTSETKTSVGIQTAWSTGQGLNSLVFDDAFLMLLRAKVPSLTTRQEPDLDLHLQLSEHERLNWPSFLEGHAKYFQRAYESVLAAASRDSSETIAHSRMHGVKPYEQ